MGDTARPPMNVVVWKIGVDLEVSDLGVSASPVSKLDEPIRRALIGSKRRAPVGERERHPVQAAESPEFHQRHASLYASGLIGDRDDEGAIPVAFGQDPCPRRMMKRQRRRVALHEL